MSSPLRRINQRHKFSWLRLATWHRRGHRDCGDYPFRSGQIQSVIISLYIPVLPERAYVDIDHLSKAQAMANYRAFRESPGDLRQNNPTWELAVSLVDIEEDVFRKSTSDDATTVDLEIAAAQQRVRAVDAFWSTLEVKGTNASGVNREVALRRAEEMVRDKNAFYARLSMALFGGLALIVPMLIMTLVPSRTTSLVTTSLCVLAVAVALSYFMKTAEAKDVMACTAGYAAVLVVFVGTGETTAAGGQSGTG